MKNIYVKDVTQKCHGKLIQGTLDTPLINFSKDTRTIRKGDVFVGIKGDNFDGNNMYEEALEKGAIGCILNKDTVINEYYLNKYKDSFIILVDDTIFALQKLASFKRSLYDIPVIAITGSVGKTSTKDIVASILQEEYHVLKTIGNLNNHIGLPLTILSLKDEDCLVVEMGMNNLGEISTLSKIARPTIGIITNIGTAHIGNLGSRENILKAKLEILDGMDNGILIINNDNDLLHDWYLKNKHNLKLVTYGLNNQSNFNAKDIKLNELFSNFKVENDEYQINIPGDHFILNALVGIAIGNLFNIPTSKIKKGLENFTLSKNRMEIEKVNNYTIINDSYNANYDSMVSAINYLGSLKTYKIAVLGDMLELGKYSEKLHRNLAKTIIDNKIDIVITVGNNAKYISSELVNLNFNKNNLYSYNSNEDAINKLKEIIKDDDTILIKASNGMHFKEIYEALKGD